MFKKQYPLLLLLLLLGCEFPLLAQATIFEDQFETGTFGPNWVPFPSVSGTAGRVDIVNAVGLNFTNGVLIGKFSDGDQFTTNTLDLYLDLTGYADVALDFWIADSYDENNPEDGLYFSDDGGDFWTKVVDFRPEDWCDDFLGRYPTVDVDALAAANGLTLNDQFIIRWQQHGLDDFNGFSTTSSDGLVLDNVRVYDPQIPYEDLPFFDDFDTGLPHPTWTQSFADATAVINTGSSTNSPMGLVELFDNTGLNGSYALHLGRRCDGTFSTNAFDLHLDLSEETNVEMGFWIRDSYDESDANDAIYFSDDDGVTWAKAVSLFPSDWCDDLYGYYPPIDVDETAAALGLSLTDRFIIRFQQHGQDDFNGFSNTSSDGFVIDNVAVYDPELEYATLPFEDDFETGVANKAWARNNADQTAEVVGTSSLTSPMSNVGVYSGSGLFQSFGVAIGRRCDNTASTNAYDLHLDLSGETDVELSFWIGDSYDESDLDDAVYFSDDGGESWAKAFQLVPDEWCDDLYGFYPPVDVDGIAADLGLSLTSTFVIRWQQRGSDDFNGFSTSSSDGYSIDEVRVYDPGLTYAPLPFSDDFNTGVFKSAWGRRNADQTSAINTGAAITSPMNEIGIFDGTGVGGTFGVLMGRRCDDVFATTNALDLHLDLSGETDVTLSFDLADSYDETDLDDGVYFSDNAGSDWVKVIDFDFDQLPDDQYFPQVHSLSGLAAKAGLTLSSTFVVRFQQHGRDDFNGFSTTSSDGMYLDNIFVAGAPTATSAGSKEGAAFEVLPNPVTDTPLTLRLSSVKSPPTLLRVRDATGRMVRQITRPAFAAGELRLATQSWPVGIYFVELLDAGGKWRVQRVIKLE